MSSNADAPTASLGFRADIEGLRAIAILLVVAAHAKVPGLAGGFVGVDVFFVLSGYLISSLLVGEYLSSGRVGLVAFYARRFRRLLPALLVMLLLSSIAALFILSSSEQIAQSMAAASAALWLSNFHFAFAELDYFGGDAEKNLFLHTWSLGVEEQFYLLWPLLIISVFAVSRRLARGAEISFLKWSMTAIVVLSFTISLRLLESSPELAFYMMPSRAWQFALGALAWLCFRSESVYSQRLIFALGWLGLGLIVSAALLLDGHAAYPGFWSLLPSLGTALVLVAGSAQVPNGVGQWLSINVLQSIGRVSYSWYLWHWPILLLGIVLMGSGSAMSRVFLVVLSLFIAILSYRLVEAPVRGYGRLIAVPRVSIYVAVLMMLGASLLGDRWTRLAQEWVNNPQQVRFLAAKKDRPAIYAMGCDDWFSSAEVKFCAFGRVDAPRTVVLMGDSIGAQWFPAVERIFGGADWRILVLTKSACPMVDEYVFYHRIRREYVECAEWRQRALLKLVDIEPDVLVLGSSTSYSFTKKQWIDGTSRVLERVADHVGAIYLIRGTPSLSFDGVDCLSNKYASPLRIVRNVSCDTPVNKSSGEIWSWLAVAAASYANVRALDMNDEVCPKGICSAELGGKIVFRDSSHLAAGFVADLALVLEDKMK
jgi:peptidoglycan/LPS O-acetylase OafA/YrhL